MRTHRQYVEAKEDIYNGQHDNHVARHVMIDIEDDAQLVIRPGLEDHRDELHKHFIIGCQMGPMQPLMT